MRFLGRWGRGGKSIRPGRHLAHPKNTPLCNLYLAMLQRAGVDVAKFGDSTDPLDLEERC